MNRGLPFWLLAFLPVLHSAPVQIRTAEFPWAIVGNGYHSLIETGVDGRCLSGDVTIAVSQGTLPRGLSIRGDALLGIPAQTGVFHFSIRAANNCSSVVKPFELVVTGKPILRVFPETLTVQQHAGQASPAPATVQVSATWPNLPYSVQADALWLTAKVRAGVTPDQGAALSADVVCLEIDAKNLAPGLYRSAVRFSTWSGANAPMVMVTLIVLP